MTNEQMTRATAAPAIFEISEYSFKVRGRRVRKATQVVFEGGYIVKFMDKLTKAEARRQAPMHYGR